MKNIIKVTILFALAGCSHFANVDRSEVNKPAMDLNSPLLSTGQPTLTNQKSSNTLSVGSCSVCAH